MELTLQYVLFTIYIYACVCTMYVSVSREALNNAFHDYLIV